MRSAVVVSALLLGIGVVACSDSPVQPSDAALPAPPAASLALSGSDLERCQALVDPDWLCESQAVRDKLCFAAVHPTTVDIEIKGRFLTLKYRVTFQPQADGSLVISVAWIKAGGTLVPIGMVTVPKDKVAKFLEGCPGPGPTAPSIEPAAGPRGTAITITDPQGRIQPGSLVLFYKLGQDPANDGVNAEQIVVVDAFTVTALVPSGALDGPILVSVRPDRASSSYFDDLTFFLQ